MNTILNPNNFNILQAAIQTAEIKKQNTGFEQAAANPVSSSIYEGGAEYPYNYNAQINFNNEDDDEDYIKEVKELISNIKAGAKELNRERLLNSVLDKEGLPIVGFDLSAVAHIGMNPHYSTPFLEKLIHKTKSQKGALFSENFTDNTETQLFGIEEQKKLTKDSFKIRTEFFDTKGKLQASCDKYQGNFVYSKFRGSKSRTITKYKEDSTRQIQRTLEFKLSIEYDDKTPKKARYLIPDEIIEGAYKEFEYDLEGINPKDEFEILNAVQSGEITPSRVISDCFEDNKGNRIYIQNYEANGYSTNRKYTTSKDGSSSLYYRITDKFGNEIFKTEREFQKIDDTSAVSIIDGKKHHIRYDNDKKLITIDNKRTIDINDKTSNIRRYYKEILLMPEDEVNQIIELGIYKDDSTVNTKDDKEILWQQAKNLPYDLLIELDDNVIYWTLDDNNDSYFVEGLMGTAKNVQRGVLAHELGHATENRTNMKYDEEIIKAILEEEVEFIKTHSGEEVSSMIYFFNNECDKGSEIETGGGINEIIAEINCLLNSAGIETGNISLRSKFLIENFPRTIALIGSRFSNQEKAPQNS